MHCPVCQTKIKEDFGLVTCSKCSTVLMVDIDGKVRFLEDEAKDESKEEHKEGFKKKLKHESQSKVEDELEGEFGNEFEVQPGIHSEDAEGEFEDKLDSSEEMKINEVAFDEKKSDKQELDEQKLDEQEPLDEQKLDEQEPLDEQELNEQELNHQGLDDQESTEQPLNHQRVSEQAFDESKEESVSKNLGESEVEVNPECHEKENKDLESKERNSSRVVSEGGQSAFLKYNVTISGIYSHKIKDAIKDVLADEKFVWDSEKIMSSIKNQTLEIQNISAIKASLFIRRIKHLELKMSWKPVSCP